MKFIIIAAEKPTAKPRPAAQDSQEEGEESAPVAAPAPAKGFSKPNSACKWHYIIMKAKQINLIVFYIFN